MKLHLLEHDPINLSNTNITTWAKKKGYQLSRTYVCEHEKLPVIDDFDWLMVMGGSPHAWEENVHAWLPAEKEFIAKVLDHNKIIMGVCFGSQLLAEALGGSVFTSEYQEIGWHEVVLTHEGRDSFLFKNIPERFTTFHWHSDHFSLPPECNSLAYSKPSANQAFTCEDRPLAGLQFHPEYTPELVKFFAHGWGHEWEKAQFVSGKDRVLDQTEELADTYWLMANLLDNMDRQFAGSS